MLKAGGIAGIIISAGMLGVIKSVELKERIRLLRDFLQLILYIRGCINYLREPLVNLVCEGKKCSSEAFDFWNGFSVDLDKKDAEIAQIWAQNVDNIYGNTCLEADDIEILKYPGTFIGQTDFENQLARFEYAEKRLEQQIKLADDCYHIKGPLYRKLGFFAGGLAAIIFI